MTIGRSARIALALLVAMTMSLAPAPASAKEPTPPPPITLPPGPDITGTPTIAAPCGEWYLTSTFGPLWPANGTWWQSICPFVGAYDESMPIWDNYFYWDGTQAAIYGTWYLEPFNTWDGHDPCRTWMDTATAQSYGPYQCTLEWDAPPVASFTFVCASLQCSFDGRSSTDSDGTIAEYLWYFGDGSDPVYGTTSDHTFAQARTYSVQLLVTDEFGLTGWSAVDVTVNLTAPVAVVTVSCSGLRCDVDGGSSTSPNGPIATYAWQFGDGTDASGARTAHVYAVPGTYPITLTVTDSSGGTASATSTVTVTDRPPVAALTAACAGPRCTFDASNSSDPDGTITSYAWQFGDGTSATGPTAVHSYAQPGGYTATLVVTDNNGVTATASAPVVVTTLTARAYKQNGAAVVDLSWSGATGMSVDVYRNGTRIATIQGASYTDALGRAARGDYTYKVCAGASMCSNEVTIRF
jgi:PKD repeat protein